MVCYAKNDPRSSGPGTRSALNEGAQVGNMRPMRRRDFLRVSAIAACSAALPVDWAACSFELGNKASNEIQLLPAGKFRPTDGRALPMSHWFIDAAIAKKIITQVDALKRKLVIDYEHQTLNSEHNGQPAPAAGWFKTLEWREGQGLFAVDVEWSARAKSYIEAGEYKYISPVFAFNKKTGAVVQLQLAALTNNPGLDGMAEARAAARFNVHQPAQEKQDMDLLKTLLAALGLPDTTTEADALAGVAALKAKADKVDSLETEVVALKAKTPDPTKYVAVETVAELQTQLAALTSQVTGREVEEVVQTALKEGRILPPQEAWARNLGKQDIAQLKAFLAATTPIPALQRQQTDGKKPAGEITELDAEQLAVCKSLGISAEDYKKNLNAQNAEAAA